MLLEVKDLNAGYATKGKKVRAVKDVSFYLENDDFLGIAGESGCGKSTLLFSLIKLLKNPGKIFDGEIIFKEKNILNLKKEELRKLRWKEFSLVTQSAMNALNPVMKIKDQFADVIMEHSKIKKLEAYKMAGDYLELVGIQRERIESYPHQLSGGQKQRVAIAMALVFSPSLVIMDEPTTALDVVVQRSIMEQIDKIRKDKKFSIIFVTHDISLLFEISKRIAIMYAGELVEIGPTKKVYKTPAHPYTKGLINSFPKLDSEIKQYEGIPGKIPDLSQDIIGCPFMERCSLATEKCKTKPEFKKIDEGRWVKCHFPL
ncbi:ABC transporter ATP-binding protein [Oceanotoga sp. DSM 15011]|jgi:peptide/nickel transport system ATP-binding protein|uniref:Peptide/nickel transport system ATP-binding protein n=1 Tax=Oceanotoga teriensis TaxID=515440 RepID=A0AA45HIL0_9BACT|nr:MULTISPECIES: ABC transporter ATP-binding protein [Oceanotoga]MDN5342032.1 peptide/nickel transport system ATP-binding protein [Oceanotoga sp.]PWJ92048.1 peptide/nickel transport system ATP-binding protein [Oceanotoga teriensis]UYO98997.1 ABC transporter ATP-binding protein [Oceanotoga sp. DSM 15011]